MFLGIDLGTSSVKAVVMDHQGKIHAEASEPLSISRPRSLMSEQSPEDWWHATNVAVSKLKEYCKRIRSIGLSGQMHGAVLLDEKDRVLRPAILWNDGRSYQQCEELEAAVAIREITGNCAMPGFTAPKILWVKQHEPQIYKQIRRVLLPKDYLRLRMTHTYATDMSDASGTLWLDVGKRSWSEDALNASGLALQQMPALFEGSDVTEVLATEIAQEWNMDRVPVVGGAGDQAAGAVGAGAVVPGRAILSLGTSGVIFVPDFSFKPNPDRGIHVFCHALPDTWHQMAVILTAASALSWVAELTNSSSIDALLTEIESAAPHDNSLFFLPYLSGERTPHNDPNALGAFIGLTHDTNPASLGYAVLEGVAFALRDCKAVLEESGTKVEQISVVGGGTESRFWGQMLADILDVSLVYRLDASVGPALGAARLAMLGATGLSVQEVCFEAPIDFVLEPSKSRPESIDRRWGTFQSLYQDLRDRFPVLVSLHREE